jgi:hypothetical protein
VKPSYCAIGQRLNGQRTAVRILLGDPESPLVDERGRSEGLGDVSGMMRNRYPKGTKGESEKD